MAKKPNKYEREKQVLLGLIDLYVQNARPVGSETLRQNGFTSVSSATIRNYFVKLEQGGFLEQAHSSAGRIPTKKGYQFYAEHYQNEKVDVEDSTMREPVKKEIFALLQAAAETLSEKTNCPVFLSTPIFAMDFVQKVRFLLLEPTKILCIVITDFGLIHTETFDIHIAITETALPELEKYFCWRFNKGEKPLITDGKLRKIGQRLYNELMVRFIVYSSSRKEKSLFQTGLSRLLNYPEFAEASEFAKGLSLFENPELMQKLLRQAMRKKELTYFIGEDFLGKYCSVILMPYYIHPSVAGAIGILGPLRLPYRELFKDMYRFSQELSSVLTKTVQKFQISFTSYDDLPTEDHVEACSSILLEHKRQ